MIIIRNLIICIIFLFLVINFILDFSAITDQFSKNGQQFIAKYLIAHKNTIILEEEIKDLTKERNKFERLKIMIEEVYTDLKDDTIEMEYKAEMLDRVFEQIDPYEFDLNIKKLNSKLEFTFNSEHSFSNDIISTRVFGPHKNILLYGIANQFPASGYLETYNNNLILMSASGVLAYSNTVLGNLKDNLIFNQIKTNIGKFIGKEQFKKSRIHDFDWLEGGWFSIKDVEIYKDQIFISYTREVRENCWNTSLLHGKMNLKLIIFKNLFTSDECVHFYDNIDDEFNAHQSGGRIVNLNDETLLFSIGDFRSRFRAQNEDSIFSKILEINKQTNEYKVISMGHRNPQGLFFDSKNNILLEAEHGPEGGDEINLIELNQEEIPNYGWAISSYGEHYGGKNAPYNKKKYVKYPLHKSHTEYGFIEPLIYFDPSIGISQIIGLKETNKYVVASMKDESLYFFTFDYDDKNITSPNKVINGRADNIEIKRVHIGERIRDMIYYNEKLYLYLEDTASLAEVTIN